MEGLDRNGSEAVSQVMNYMSEQGKTAIIFSHDHQLLKGKGYILDLDKKPVPELLVQKGKETVNHKKPYKKNDE